MKHFTFYIFLAACSINLTGQPVDLEKDLVANYQFSGNAQDASSFANHGIINGATLTQDRFGNAASAYYFNGINDHIIVPDANILSFPEQKLSIALWIKTDRLSHSYMVYKGSTPTNREYAIGINNERTIATQVINPGAATGLGVFSNTVIDFNEWYHIVVTWDGRYISIYINAVLEDRNEGNISLGNLNSNLYFGSYGGDIGLYAYPGIIDDIYIYNRVINECEIEALYSGQEFIER